MPTPAQAAKHKIVIEQGATFDLNVTYKDSTGTLVNLTGWTARMDVRSTHSSGTTLLTSQGGSPTITLTLGGANGTVDVKIGATATAGLTAPASAVYDLELINGSGDVTRLIEGAVSITPEVTRT